MVNCVKIILEKDDRGRLTEYSVDGMISSRIIPGTGLIRRTTKKPRDTGN